MSKHPLLLYKLRHLLKVPEWSKITNLHLGDHSCIYHHLEVADSILNEFEISWDPSLPIRVAVSGDEHLRLPLIWLQSVTGLVWQRVLLIVRHHELLAHHLEGAHKVIYQPKLLDDWWHDSERTTLEVAQCTPWPCAECEWCRGWTQMPTCYVAPCLHGGPHLSFTVS